MPTATVTLRHAKREFQRPGDDADSLVPVRAAHANYHNPFRLEGFATSSLLLSRCFTTYPPSLCGFGPLVILSRGTWRQGRSVLRPPKVRTEADLRRPP